MKRNRVLVLAVLTALALCLTACGGGGGSSSTGGSAASSSSMPDESSTSAMAPSGSQSEEEEPPAPVLPYVNPLTGGGTAEDLSGNRPIAVLINNLKKAYFERRYGQAGVVIKE